MEREWHRPHACGPYSITPRLHYTLLPRYRQRYLCLCRKTRLWKDHYDVIHFSNLREWTNLLTNVTSSAETLYIVFNFMVCILRNEIWIAKKFRLRYVSCIRNVSSCSSRYCWHLCVDFSNYGLMLYKLNPYAAWFFGSTCCTYS